MLIHTHLIWQKDSTRRRREGILGLHEDEVAQGGDGTSDGLAIESDLGRKLRAHPVRGLRFASPFIQAARLLEACSIQIKSY